MAVESEKMLNGFGWSPGKCMLHTRNMNLNEIRTYSRGNEDMLYLVYIQV